MKYYKFINKLKGLYDYPEIREGLIYPGNNFLIDRSIEDWSKDSITGIDWVEMAEEEYNNQFSSSELCTGEGEINVTTMSMFDFPIYSCHWQVGALKIKSIKSTSSLLNNFLINKQEVPTIKLEFEGNYKSIEVTSNWMAENKPQVEGYFVIYEDGCTSYIPADEFEKRYTKL